MQLDTRCPVCHWLDEDGGHCFLKCKLVKRCWSTLSLEPVRQQLLSKQSAWEVVTEILSLKEEVRTKTVLFLWKWWTERNKINKGEKGQGVDGVAADVLNLLNDLSKSERKEPIRQTAGNARWKAPPLGQLKINSDGSFIQETMQGSWGFIVRDYEGEVVLAGACRLGSIPDAITAEAAACARALQAATDHGISRVQVEMDSTIL